MMQARETGLPMDGHEVEVTMIPGIAHADFVMLLEVSTCIIQAQSEDVLVLTDKEVYLDHCLPTFATPQRRLFALQTLHT